MEIKKNKIKNGQLDCVRACARACLVVTSAVPAGLEDTKAAHQQTHQSLFTGSNWLGGVAAQRGQACPLPLRSITVLFTGNISAGITPVITAVIQARPFNIIELSEISIKANLFDYA